MKSKSDLIKNNFQVNGSCKIFHFVVGRYFFLYFDFLFFEGSVKEFFLLDLNNNIEFFDYLFLRVGIFYDFFKKIL